MELYFPWLRKLFPLERFAKQNRVPFFHFSVWRTHPRTINHVGIPTLLSNLSPVGWRTTLTGACSCGVNEHRFILPSLLRNITWGECYLIASCILSRAADTIGAWTITLFRAVYASLIMSLNVCRQTLQHQLLQNKTMPLTTVRFFPPKCDPVTIIFNASLRI